MTDTTGSSTISRAELGAYFRRHGYGQPGDRAMAVFEDIVGHRGQESQPAGADGDRPALADMIVRWSEVQAGDLVLHGDELIRPERVEVVRKPWGDGTDFTAVDVYRRLDNGVLVSTEQRGDGLTAVRRLDDGSALADAQHAIGNVIRHAEGTLLDDSASPDAGKLARVLLAICGPWTGGLRVEPGPAPASRCTWWSDPSDDFYGMCVKEAHHDTEGDPDHENGHGIRWTGRRWEGRRG